MNYRNWEFITYDHKVVMITGSIENPLRTVNAPDIPENAFIEYQKYLTNQLKLCEEILKNHECKVKQ